MTYKTQLFVLFFSFWALFSYSQNRLPSVQLKDIRGQSIDTQKLSDNKGNPVIICFIKTCCNSPVNLLDDIAEVYEDWQEETGVVMYVIATDDARSTCSVAPKSSMHEWNFPIYLDPNSDFKRKMNVIVNPHAFLLNGDGKIVWQKGGYTNGDVELIYKELLKLNQRIKQ